jgi:hypothetical protein
MLALEQHSRRRSFAKLDLESRLRILIEEFCWQAQRDGLRVEPFAVDDPLAGFRARTLEAQTALYRNFERYYRVCHQHTAKGRSLRATKPLLWEMLKESGLRPCSDLFDRIHEEDVVEVYDSSFMQIFRNTTFMELCTYTMDDIFTREFPELYRRPVEVNNILVSYCTAFFSGERFQTLQTEVPEHDLEEIASRKMRVFRIKQGIISPLFNRARRPVAVVGTLRAKILKG